jgi:hypothetical protein
VLAEGVAVIGVDLRDRRLGDEVKDVAAAAAHADDNDLPAFQLGGDRGDFGAGRGRVEVLEDRVVLGVRGDKRSGIGANGRIELLRRSAEDRGVGRDLVVIVVVVPFGLRLGRKALRGNKPIMNLDRRRAAADDFDRAAVLVAGIVAGEEDRVVKGLLRPVVLKVQLGDQRAVRDGLCGRHIGNARHDQVAGADGDVEAFREEPGQIGATSDWSA